MNTLELIVSAQDRGSIAVWGSLDERSGKYAGMIVRGDCRPLLTSPPVFFSEGEAKAGMKKIIEFAPKFLKESRGKSDQIKKKLIRQMMNDPNHPLSALNTDELEPGDDFVEEPTNPEAERLTQTLPFSVEEIAEALRLKSLANSLKTVEEARAAFRAERTFNDDDKEMYLFCRLLELCSTTDEVKEAIREVPHGHRQNKGFKAARMMAGFILINLCSIDQIKGRCEWYNQYDKHPFWNDDHDLYAFQRWQDLDPSAPTLDNLKSLLMQKPSENLQWYIKIRETFDQCKTVGDCVRALDGLIRAKDDNGWGYDSLGHASNRLAIRLCLQYCSIVPLNVAHITYCYTLQDTFMSWIGIRLCCQNCKSLDKTLEAYKVFMGASSNWDQIFYDFDLHHKPRLGKILFILKMIELAPKPEQ